MYELKPECAKEFNLYFYHFSRAEQSKVIGKIKNVAGKDCIVFLKRWGFTMLPRLVLNTWPQVICPPQSPKVLGLQVSATAAGRAPSPDSYHMMPHWVIIKLDTGIREKTHLSFDRLPFAVDHCVWSNNAIRARICFHHFELHSTHPTTDKKNVSCESKQYKHS